MRRVTCHQGQLQIDSPQALTPRAVNGFVTGQEALDQLLPGGAFARGNLHEFLTLPGDRVPAFVAITLARAATQNLLPRRLAVGPQAHPILAGQLLHTTPKNILATNRTPSPVPPAASRAIVWCEREPHLYPPAVAAMGIPLERFLLLRPQSDADEVWAIAECLRCPGVAATIASPRRLSPIQARRLQLAAETGGGVGILLRPLGHASTHHAAATRWLVQPAPGERTTQRWQLQLIHGHGGRVGQSVILEVSRETDSVRVSESLVDRPVPPQTARRFA